MKKGLDNIGDIFKGAFDGFEPNVDPSVWNNVQNAIGSGAAGGVDPNVVNTVVAGSKAFVVKVVATVFIIGTVITSIVYITAEDEAKEPSTEEKSINDAVDLEKELTTEASQISTTIISNSNNEKQRIEATDLNEEKTVVDASEYVKEPNNHILHAEESIASVDSDEGSERNNVLDNIVQKSEKDTKPKNQNTDNDAPIETIEEKEEPIILEAKIIANTFSGKAPLDVEFGVEGSGIVSYLWDFGDDKDISGEENPYHTFDEPGVYQVILTIIDEEANTKRLVRFVEAEKNVTSFLDSNIPKAFSPNGDGENDILKIKGENIKVFNARVMNSQGKTIFEWNNIDGYWDGKDRFENKVSEGAYFLDIYAKGDDGKEHKKRLTINVYH